MQESPEEVRLRNKKESEILIGNLASGTLIPQHEILADVAQLRVLAQLHESLVSARLGWPGNHAWGVDCQRARVWASPMRGSLSQENA